MEDTSSREAKISQMWSPFLGFSFHFYSGLVIGEYHAIFVLKNKCIAPSELIDKGLTHFKLRYKEEKLN